jgi:predicted phosphodiesterase
MVRFLVLGDVHAQLKLINARIQEHSEVDAILQCGDFGIWKREDFVKWGYIVDKHGHWDISDSMVPFEDVVDGKLKFDRPVIFITGNHEGFNYRDSIDWIRLLLSGGNNMICWLKEDIPFTIKEKKIKIAGLNGCYSYKVYTDQYQKRKKIKVKPETPPHIEEYLNSVMGRDPRGRFTKKDVDSLKKIKADILLLHEPPIGMYQTGDLAISQKPGSSPVNELIETMQPRVAFVGHMHKKAYFEIGITKIYGLPCIERGYALLDTNDWGVLEYAN